MKIENQQPTKAERQEKLLHNYVRGQKQYIKIYIKTSAKIFLSKLNFL